ncbi:MAG: hypothetical protein EAZ38_15540, partial [Cytophagales bacterium]
WGRHRAIGIPYAKAQGYRIWTSFNPSLQAGEGTGLSEYPTLKRRVIGYGHLLTPAFRLGKAQDTHPTLKRRAMRDIF